MSSHRRPGWQLLEGSYRESTCVWGHTATGWHVHMRPQRAFLAMSPTSELKAGPFLYLADAQEWVESQVQATPNADEVLL